MEKIVLHKVHNTHGLIIKTQVVDIRHPVDLEHYYSVFAVIHFNK